MLAALREANLCARVRFDLAQGLQARLDDAIPAAGQPLRVLAQLVLGAAEQIVGFLPGVMGAAQAL